MSIKLRQHHQVVGPEAVKILCPYGVVFCLYLAVAMGTPSLLQNLPRQQSNQDADEDSSQDVAELSSLGVEDSTGGGSVGQVSGGSETSTVDGGDISQGEPANSGSHQIILRLLEDGETVRIVLQLFTSDKDDDNVSPVSALPMGPGSVSIGNIPFIGLDVIRTMDSSLP